MHGGKANERMLDVIAGQIAIGRSGDRSRVSSAAAMARTCSVAFARSSASPFTRRIALGEKHAVGRGLAPVHQTLG